MDLKRVRPVELLAPAAGAVYIVLWAIAEAGRLGNGAAGPIVAFAPVVLFGIAIAISQRWPAIALGLIGATLALQLLVEGARFTNTSWPAYLPLLYAVFNASAFGSRPVHRVALPFAVVTAGAITVLLTLRTFGAAGWPVLYSSQSAREFQDGGELEIVGMFAAVAVISVGLAVGAWCAGLAMRLVAQTVEARRQADALERDLAEVEDELLALSEREHLAHEVHDVMAHSLAVITAQADGTRMVDGALSTSASAALATIADTARDGLVELRRLLDAHPGIDDGGRPRLAELPQLVERVRAAGRDCEFSTFGEAKLLTPIQQLSVFRIVQESLTNAVRHADAAGVTTVVLDWRGPGLALLVSAPAATVTPEGADGTDRAGRGIRGMQERARLAGGWLTAELDADGGAFIVSVFIPVDATEVADAAEVTR